MEVKDIKLLDNDLYVKNGDFVCDFSDSQHVEDIIKSYAGWWKEFATLGVGVLLYQNSTGKGNELKNNIQIQLKGDGYQVNQTNIDAEFNINVDAVRIK